MPTLDFMQVDVFSKVPFKGNPLAVVIRADSLTDSDMAAFAAWTNLSETVFLLQPSVAGADYRLRIFTPAAELPFAGHPTLGACHVWLAAGGKPQGEEVVQECLAGLVRIRRDGARLAFAAPPLVRTGPVQPDVIARIAAGLRIAPESIRASQWVDNGPGWVAVKLGSRREVLALRPDMAALKGIKVGVVAPWEPAQDGPDAQFEVRAFVPDLGIPEDPVTGSLNAGLAQWLIGSGQAPGDYVAAQGTALNRAGRVHVRQAGPDIWIGGDTTVCIKGTVSL